MASLQLVATDIEDRRARYRLFLEQVFAAVEASAFDARRGAERDAAGLKLRDAIDVEQGFLREHALALTAILFERPQASPLPERTAGANEPLAAEVADVLKRMETSVTAVQEHLVRLQSEVGRLQSEVDDLRKQRREKDDVIEKSAADAARLAAQLRSEMDGLKAELGKTGERLQRLELARSDPPKPSVSANPVPRSPKPDAPRPRVR